MTTLAITPNWKNKSAKFKGTVAAGEHVSVTIQNNDGEGGEFIADASTLRLRVVDPCNGRTLAIFPEPVPEGETPETWDSDLSPLRCTLNLNTVQMLKAVPPAANVPLLWVLDDYDNNTLYFKEQFPVEHWPRLRGEEEPTDLDNYKDIIADFNARLDGYNTRITGAENAAQAATANASAAAVKANQAVGIANQAVSKAETAQNSAAASAEAAHNSALAAEEAQEAAESAAESINSPDATLTEEGVAADAKATGEEIAAEETRAKAAEAAEETRAKGVESGLRTDLTAAEKAIDDEATLRAAADADLEANKADKIAVAAISSDVAAAQTAISNLSANKADKATTYTKTEVDTKIAGVQTFQKYLVNELPDPDEADMKGLYLVPTGETSEEGDLCEEWTVIEENGEKRWEKIGGTTVDISSKQDKLYVVYPGDWTVSAYQHNEQIDAFVDAAVDVDVTITQQGPAQFLYVLTGYDTESYYVTPVVSTARTDNILFGVYDSSATTLYGYIRATLVESRQDVPAEVLSQVVPTGDNLVKTSGIWSAIWGALASLPADVSSLYDWCVAQLAGKVPTSRTVNGQPLSSDVTLTGADIAVSGTDPTKIDAALAGKATKADATLTPMYSDTPTFSEWSFNPATDRYGHPYVAAENGVEYILAANGEVVAVTESYSNATMVSWVIDTITITTATRTRTDILGYTLGSQNDKPLASEAEAETLRTGKQDALTFDNAPTTGSNNPVKSGGIWSSIWGALTALPTGFTSLYDWCVSQLAGKASKSDVDPLLFAQYYPDGSVKSAAEFTAGIKYDAPDTTNRTITVKPFCNTGDSENDNSNLSGRVVLPPFVDASGNPYISDDGTRYKVVGVSGGSLNDWNDNLTAVVAPSTVTTIGDTAFGDCTSLSSLSLPAATTIGGSAFFDCTSLSSLSLPAATTIGGSAFALCTSLASVSLPAATTIGEFAFNSRSALTSVDFGATSRSSVPTLGGDAFYDVPPSCTIVVPYTQYDAWIAADGWKDLPQEFVRHPEKADKPTTFTTGNLAKFDANGNPTDSTIPAANVALKGEIPYSLVAKTIANGAVTLDDRAINAVAVSSSLASLTVNFPTATSGKARDFGLRLTVASGITTAPELALPQGVVCENADGEAPEIGADGAATILYFTETASGVFLVKGEVVQTITQA